MPEYLAPGVYVEEVEIGGKPIEGVSTSTAGFAGQTERGPVGATLITGLEEYRRLFGALSWVTDGRESRSTLPFAIEGYFLNGGKRCFVARILGDKAATAVLDLPLEGGAPPAGRGGPKPAKDAAGEQGDVVAAVAAPGGQESDPAPGHLLRLRALGPGGWGNRVFVQLLDGHLKGTAANRFRLVVTCRDGNDRAVLQEVYDDLSANPDSPSFVERRVNGVSTLVSVRRAAVAPPGASPGRPAAAEAPAGGWPLAGGSDGDPPVLGDWRGSDAPGARTGLAALAAVDEISILCAPDDQDTDGLAAAVVEQCERLADRIAIISAHPAEARKVGTLAPAGQADGAAKAIDSKYAAFYAPMVRIVEASTGRIRAVPPAGHVAGVFARTDNERGVWKAPANEVLRGVVGLDPEYSTAEQEILNPRGVNCIRALPGRGIRVWGARTTSSDPLWRYVNVRRLFLFIEESIDQGTQWVVFEPNDQRLWARVRQSVTDFLTTLWRSGALIGATAEQAFFVKCDATTMTQADLASGRLIMLIGVAPVKPAEFVILRIAQWTRGANETA